MAATAASLEFGQRVCPCGCGRLILDGRSDRVYSSDACKARAARQRKAQGAVRVLLPPSQTRKLPAADLAFAVVEARVWIRLIEFEFEDALLALSRLYGGRRSDDAIRWAKDFIEADPSSARVFA
jgi:hypothetical protein